MQFKNQQLESNMDQLSDSKLGKEYHYAVYCHLDYLYAEYIMQNVRPDKAQARIKIARRNISNLRKTDDTTLMAENEEELKNLLMRMKESEKTGLKIMVSGAITSW